MIVCIFEFICQSKGFCALPNLSYILKNKIFINVVESWCMVKRYRKLFSLEKVRTWRKDVLL